uniref:Uncharacterized protein n=1 Tax=Rhizophora mucronata TaxID=61149 RepID=A0A2P2QK32_RHIMU
MSLSITHLTLVKFLTVCFRVL